MWSGSGSGGRSSEVGRQSDFDRQASSFDKRAGVGPEAAPVIADSVVRISELCARDLVLEIGSGTGEIGRFLTRGSWRYLGLDASLGMLRAFRSSDVGDRGLLAVADADRDWPVPDGVVKAVFFSRVLHRLDVACVASQIRRVAQDRCCVLVGRVHRDPNGYKDRLRDRMHEAIVARGLVPRPGRSESRDILGMLRGGAGAVSDAAVAIGPDDVIGSGDVVGSGDMIGPVDVASWTSVGTCEKVLSGWSSKDSLAGVSLGAAMCRDVVDEVGRWAVDAIGPLGSEQCETERYTLSGVWIRGGS